MFINFKKIFFSLAFNSCIFIFLIISIQNSSKKISINFLINETIKLPVSFIIGSSFITGSIVGGILPFNFQNGKE